MQRPNTPPAAACTIGIANAEAATGLSWAQVKRLARTLGVPFIRLSHKSIVIDAAAFTAALNASGRTIKPARVPADDIDRALIECGLK
jgi:hypothetical protein